MANRRVATNAAETRLSAAIGEQGVILEQLRSQMTLVLEAVTATRTELKTEMGEMEARLSARITLLEQVVRQNSVDIRKNSADIRKNSEDICELRAEVARLRHDFDHRSEIERLASLEERVLAIETRLGRSA